MNYNYSNESGLLMIFFNAVELTTITEMREWKPALYHDVEKTEEHIKRCPNMSPEFCFTIVFNNGKSREHNLVGPDAENVKIWMTTIMKVVRDFRAIKHDRIYFSYEHFTFIFKGNRISMPGI